MKPLCIVLCSLLLVGCSDDDKAKSPPERTARPQPTAKPFPELLCNAAEPTKKADGKIVACIATKPTKVGPITCAQGNLVELYTDGKLKECTLERAHTWNGVPCRAKAAAKWFKSGKLYQCSVDKPYATSGVRCRDRLTYHENGKLHRCQLAESAKLGEIEIPAQSQLSLDDRGKPIRVERPEAEPLAFASYRCSVVEYHPTGAVKICTTAEEAKVGAKKLPAGSRLCFDPEGKPATGAAAGCVAPK